MTVRSISLRVYSWVFKKEREGDFACLKCCEAVQRKKYQMAAGSVVVFFAFDGKVELMEVLRNRNSLNLMCF